MELSVGNSCTTRHEVVVDILRSAASSEGQNGLRARRHASISREERGLSSADPSRTPGFLGGIFLGLSVLEYPNVKCGP